ncbi:peptidoglycan-binding domain-containing protein [Iodidimonas sp. SYSU 1G8]|uniref:peptidoglycan-binding domain-containing protein n=1 Tax=Iodidimonas sp. SYSU 1G8 TaxID=3133967 RepID=UPI0031FEC84F
MNIFSRTTAAALLMVVAMTGQQAMAADAKGNYIVRGVGARPCSDFLKAVGGTAEDVRPFLSWMDGYLSGLNALQAQTYDVAPFTSAAVIGQMVRNYCNLQPSFRFETAVLELMKVLGPYRVPVQSQLVEVTVGDANAALRQSTLMWMQQKMKEQGFFKGTPDGLYGAGTKDALVAYQKANKIAETGVPDSTTLAHFIQKETGAKKP